MGWLDWAFPERCVGCGSWGKLVCEKCEIGMGEADQICPGCGRNSWGGVTHPGCRKLTGLLGLIGMWEYEGIVRKLITQSKYNFYFDYLQKLVVWSVQLSGREEYGYLGEFMKLKPAVVPVPLFYKRVRERGFNQAKIIGQVLAGHHNLPLVDGWLVRTRDTGRQVGRSRAERLLAMKGAFEVNSKQNPVNALLVDDVWTTGATMRECAEVLKKAGIKRVWGFTLAR